jgi:predicted Ser/Thr protein kinase
MSGKRNRKQVDQAARNNEDKTALSERQAKESRGKLEKRLGLAEIVDIKYLHLVAKVRKGDFKKETLRKEARACHRVKQDMLTRVAAFN